MDRIWSLTSDFKFDFTLANFDIITTTDYLSSIDKTVKIIYDEMTTLNLNKVGLCLSGVDSELIAHYLAINGITTEYFFLDIDGTNSADLILCQNIAKKYNNKLNVISITIEQLLEEIIYTNFDITNVCWPTYVTIPTLIKNIPNDYYIITGEGDLEKDSDDRYSKIYHDKITVHSPDNFYIPVHLTEVAYKRAMTYYQKQGESNFYSRCFDSWYHILKDTRLITNGQYLYDPKRNIINDIAAKQRLLSPNKTLNYTEPSLKRNIITRLIQYGNKISGWHPYIGDIIILPKNMIV